MYSFVVLVFVCASRKADLQHYNDSQSYGWYSEEREGMLEQRWERKQEVMSVEGSVEGAKNVIHGF